MPDNPLVPANSVSVDTIKVQPDEILNETKTNTPNTLVSAPPTFMQKAGMQLAAGVGIVGGIIIFSVVGDWMLHRPELPNLSTLPADLEKASQIVKNYKDLVDANNARSIAFFDAVVTKTLLPVFTAILGYIFGAKSADNAAAKNAE